MAMHSFVAGSLCLFAPGGGDPGFTLSNPPTVEIGKEVTFTLQVPYPAFAIYYVSLGEGPTKLPWGTMCLDFPPLLQVTFFLPGGTPVPLTATVPCDDVLVGLEVYQQFVAFDTSHPKTRFGISNQTSLEIVAPGGLAEDYADFGALGGLQLNGNAVQVGNVVRLAPDAGSQAGTMFYATPLSIGPDTSFRTRFQFRIHGVGRDGADGMTLMVQGHDEFVVGVNGSGLGYGGIDKSVAIEIDNWDSGPLDPSDNHLGLLQNGDYTRHYAFYNPPFDLENNVSHEVWVDYCGATDLLEVYLAETAGGARPDTPVISRTVDLHALVGGLGYLGFSAATGAVTNNHDVENWEFVVW